MANTVYETYRNGAESLEDHLRESIRAFYQRYSRLPISVVVSSGKPKGSKEEDPTHKDTAESALKALDLPDLLVRVAGGCLVGEVWLQVEGHPPSRKERA